MKNFRAVILALCSCMLCGGSFADAAVVIDHTSTDLSRIPDLYITQAKANLHIAYQHTSHGSQLISGMNALQSFPAFGTKYSWTDEGTAGTLDLDDDGIPGDCADLSTGDYIDAYGVTPWVTSTRALLNTPGNTINVVVWSWCSINGHNAQRYVDNMEILIAQYPAVQFVFMTGHAEGQGEDMTPDSVHYNNQLIRTHCAAHNRILFDFANIEAYDPNGAYFWDKAMEDHLAYTGGNWAVEWIAAHPAHELAQLTTGCSDCAHSPEDGEPTEAKLNCVLKGRAAWWLWARLADWSGTGGGSTTTTTAGTSTTTTAPCPSATVLGADSPKLVHLRTFRDSGLARSAVGRRIIEIYYNNAGSINAALDRSPALRAVSSSALEILAPLVGTP